MKEIDELLFKIEDFFKNFKVLSSESYDKLYKRNFHFFYVAISISLKGERFKQYIDALKDLLSCIDISLKKELIVILNILYQTEQDLLSFKESQSDERIRKDSYLALSNQIDSLCVAISEYRLHTSYNNLFAMWKKDFHANYLSWDIIPSDVKSLILIFLSQCGSDQDIFQFRLLNKKANDIFVNFLKNKEGAEWILGLFEKKIYDIKIINAIVNFCLINNCLDTWKVEKGLAYLSYALCTDDFKNIDQKKLISILEALKPFHANQFKRVIVNLKLMNLLSDIPQMMNSIEGKAWKKRYEELQNINI